MAHTAETKQSDPSGCPEITDFKYNDQNTTRWSSLTKVLSRPSSKFAPGPFDENGENLEALQEDFRVLVVGAGGLGCEILKNLALSGFTDIEVIDLDIIDLSNLNRQFLFRKKDIGKPKAQIAAEFVMQRVPGCRIKWYQTKIQNKSESFYAKFNVVIAGLDNIEARRWLNAILCDLVKTDDDGNIDPDTLIPLIDGGTEGFSGQCRVFIPRVTSCFECSLGLITPQRGFALCTLAGNPRRPEHCIAWAKILLWPKLKSIESVDKYEFMQNMVIKVDDLKKEEIKKMMEKIPNNPVPVKLDTDEVNHMSWLYNRALEYADLHSIKGVTYEFTMQVVKNIIPAIASTNALISALCVSEAFKIVTWCSFGLDNWIQYVGQCGLYSNTIKYEKNTQCLVCGTEPFHYKMDPNTKFVTLYHKIYHDEAMGLQKPAVSRSDGGPLWMTSKTLREHYKENLGKPIQELFESDTILLISDKRVLGNRAAKIRIEFVKDEKFISDCEECGFGELIKVRSEKKEQSMDIDMEQKDSVTAPQIKKFQWGIVDIVYNGETETFKDVVLTPNSAKEWNWKLDGTKHKPGITIKAIEDNQLLEESDYVILTKGVKEVLCIKPETVQYMDTAKQNGKIKDYFVLQSNKAVEKYNELIQNQQTVSGLFHSTC